MGMILYCGDCGNYLMVSDGECHDCQCGWKQPRENEEIGDLEDESELQQNVLHM